MNDEKLAIEIARAVESGGGRAYFVGGYVRDKLTGDAGKDIDIEVFGIAPERLREVLSEIGEPFDKGASFGVIGMRGTDIDVAMPRRESRAGVKHTDFDVSVDPFMTPREASVRRDFTINAMMMDAITGEILDFWGGRTDLEARVIRHVSDETFADDALRVFRAAQFAARLGARVAPETADICRRIDVTFLSRERVYEELLKALLKARTPGVFFRVLREMDKLGEFFPEIGQLTGVEQNPQYHPEGDVFEHTMLTIDAAAGLRHIAKEPANFMLAALLHDLGKYDASEVIDGRITSHRHPETGMILAQRQLERLTTNARTMQYVKNMVQLHMRPNILARANSKKAKTRKLFDESVCPEDLILLSRADAMGKKDKPYDMAHWEFLMHRLADYRACMQLPMVAGADLIEAGYAPGKRMGEMLRRARALHFSGMSKARALEQVMKEYPR
ncbi:MAG: CCA tRNA nucleotidyltransferase [Christensenellales bacterium]|jgi:tRNA nucleotidyltransferase (CCA-adding enzyme)